jgi:hypothetical protein
MNTQKSSAAMRDGCGSTPAHRPHLVHQHVADFLFDHRNASLQREASRPAETKAIIDPLGIARLGASKDAGAAVWPVAARLATRR